MKAVGVMCSEKVSASNGVSGVASGRISRHRDVENEEIQMYISKLKDLVPFMPKNRKLTKLEVIQNVIDYICALQNALETHPAVNAFDAAAVLGQKKSQGAASPRQPLGVRSSPNTILAPSEAPVLQGTTVSGFSFLPTLHTDVTVQFTETKFKTFCSQNQAPRYLYQVNVKAESPYARTLT